MPQRIYGYPAALVLTDERGEFEVRDAIKFATFTSVPMAIDHLRVQDAVHMRIIEKRDQANRRPVY